MQYRSLLDRQTTAQILINKARSLLQSRSLRAECGPNDAAAIRQDYADACKILLGIVDELEGSGDAEAHSEFDPAEDPPTFG